MQELPAPDMGTRQEADPPAWEAQLGLVPGEFAVKRSDKSVETGWNIDSVHDYTPEGADAPYKEVRITKELVDEYGEVGDVLIKQLPLDEFMDWQKQPEADADVGDGSDFEEQIEENSAELEREARVEEAAEDIADLEPEIVEQAGVALDEKVKEDLEASEAAAEKTAELTDDQKRLANKNLNQIASTIDDLDRRPNSMGGYDYLLSAFQHSMKDESVNAIPGLPVAMRAAVFGSMRSSLEAQRLYQVISKDIKGISEGDEWLHRALTGVVNNQGEIMKMREREDRNPNPEGQSRLLGDRANFASYASTTAERIAKELEEWGDSARAKLVRGFLHGMALGVAPQQTRHSHFQPLSKGLTK